MAFVRLYSGSDGDSHFEELEMPFGVGEMKKTAWSDNAALAATPSYLVPEGIESMVFASQSALNDPPTFALTKKRHYLITLAGEGEIELRSGEVRRIGPADVLLLEDLTGNGHLTNITSKPWVWVAISLAG